MTTEVLLSQLPFLLISFDLQILSWALMSELPAPALLPTVAHAGELQTAWSGLQENSMYFLPIGILLCAPHQR